MSISDLVPSADNVRVTNPLADLDGLKASIRASGVIQSLTVLPITKGKNKGRFAVIAGQRRLAALTSLVAAGALPADHPIPVIVRHDAENAIAVSAAENIIRTPMHPADEFDAFKKLRDQGKSNEDIAAAFGLSTVVVERRLRLAHVSAKLMQAFRDGHFGIKQMEAFAATEDHTRQDEYLGSLNLAGMHQDHYMMRADNIRRSMLEGSVGVNDPRVLCVGMDAYRAEGGRVNIDLFGDHTALLDAPLLDRLVLEQAAPILDGLRGEGWKWVEFMGSYTGRFHHNFHDAAQTRALTDEEAALESQLQESLNALEQDGEASAADIAAIQVQLDALDASRTVYSDAARLFGGAAVYLDGSGGFTICRARVRGEDYPDYVQARDGVATEAAGKADGDVLISGVDDVAGAPNSTDDAGTPIDDVEAYSAKLQSELLASRGLGLQVALLHNPLLAHALMQRAIIMRGYAWGETLEFRVTAHPPAYVALGSAWAESNSAAMALIEGARKTLDSLGLPTKPDALLAFIMDDANAATVARAVTICVALGADATSKMSASVASAAHFDLRQTWTPTVASYFGRVTKGHIVAALDEMGVQLSPREQAEPKSVLAVRAAAEAQARRWLPAILRQSLDCQNGSTITADIAAAASADTEEVANGNWAEEGDRRRVRPAPTTPLLTWRGVQRSNGRSLRQRPEEWCRRRHQAHHHGREKPGFNLTERIPSRPMPSAAVTYIAAKLSGQPEPRIEHKPTAPHNMHAIRRRMGGINQEIRALRHNCRWHLQHWSSAFA